MGKEATLSSRDRGLALQRAITAEIEALDVPVEVPGGTPVSRVSDAAAAVEHAATKVQMLFSGGDDVPADAADSALGEFHDAYAAFVAHAVSSLGTRGATFDAGVKEAAREVASACAAFAGTATLPTASANDKRAALSGVWEKCRAIKTLPKDGRAAVSKAFMRCATFVKDTATELAEIGAGANDDDDDDDSARDDEEGLDPRRRPDPDDVDMFFDDAHFDAGEMRVAKQCAAFAAAAFQLMRDLVAPVVRGAASEVGALERALRLCVAFQRDVENVGAGAYPPQDAEDLARCVKGAMERAGGMCAAIAEAGGVEGAEAAGAKFAAAGDATLETLDEAARTGGDESAGDAE